jgi:PhnB protein
MSNAKPIPDGFHTLTPYLVVDGAAAAIDFYKRAFGARELGRMPGPNGKIMHADLQIGNSRLMLADEMPQSGAKSPKALGGSPITLFVYVENVDIIFNQALAAGAKEKMPLANQFWGDRYGQVTDPFGHVWQLATHVEDVTPDEMARRAAQQMAQPASSR